MNDIINWIAVNNTLMIRIGFIAILILLVTYLFRFFFMPSVNIIPEAAEKDVKDKTDSELHAKVEEKQAQHYTQEIEKLLLEVSKLKEQLSDSELLVSDLQTKISESQAAKEAQFSAEAASVAKEAQSTAEATSEAKEAQPSAEAPSAASNALISELKNKIEVLEARLAEYEIIAEDISEISQLRKENAALKKRLDEAPLDKKEPASTSEAVEAKPADEAVSEQVATVVSDELLIVDESAAKSDESEPAALIEELQAVIVDANNPATVSENSPIEPAVEAVSEEVVAVVSDELLIVEESIPESNEEPTPEALIEELHAAIDEANKSVTGLKVTSEQSIAESADEEPTPEALMEELQAAIDDANKSATETESESEEVAAEVGEEVSLSARELIDQFDEISKKKGS